MSTLKLFDPLFSDNLENAMRRFFSPAGFDADLPHLRMRIDVTENDKGYAVIADIPGVKKEDINVRIDGNVVQIDAETRRETEEKGNGDKVLRSERSWGTISRTFSLGDEIDQGKVEAKYTDGVLTLQLPKKAGSEAKKISIQ